MIRRSLLLLGSLAWAAGALACGPHIDLKRDLAVTDVFTGWYDDGMHDGLSRLVPSISFKLKNTGPAAFATVRLTVAFWRESPESPDGEIEWDSAQVEGIGATALPVGASTDPILVRATVGYTLAAPSAAILSNSEFKDATAKIFASRGGVIVPLGEYKLDRRLLPHVARSTQLP